MSTKKNSALRLLMATLGAIFMFSTAGLIQAGAQELAPEHLALARQYVDMTDNAKVYESSLLQSGIDSMKTILKTNPDIQAQADEAVGRTIESYVARKSELMDQFARVYAIRFSMDELKDIVAFYSTPSGKKLSDSNAAINADLRRVLNVFTNNLREEFFAKVRINLKEQGIEL